MHVTTLTVQGGFDVPLTDEILTNEEIQDNVIDNVISILREKGYYGVVIAAQFITEENQNLFKNYISRFSDRLRQDGFLSLVAINPKIYQINNEVRYERIDYSDISDMVDDIIFLQYRWAISDSPPGPIISVRNIDIFSDYALTQIEPEKIVAGIPTFGYRWELPYVDSFSRSSSISRENAINLAREVGAAIQFDEVSQTPYFYYVETDINNTQYVVWFVNSITADSLLQLYMEKDVFKTGLWNIMAFYAQLYLVINSQFVITKLLPEF